MHKNKGETYIIVDFKLKTTTKESKRQKAAADYVKIGSVKFEVRTPQTPQKAKPGDIIKVTK